MPRTAASRRDVLDLFQPVVGEWFRESLGEPTEIQARAWPQIAAGKHVLVSAPTASGKTLAAFLWGLDRLLSGDWEGGRVRFLYVSPLKALNNDVRRNLLAPLAALRARLEARGEPAPRLRVATRSGDTPGSERRRMLRQPPEILITTPESLNILLTSQGGRSLLGGVRCLILDEIHAVVGSKRGIHLITAVERVARLAGEFQRLALSATIRPPERVARFVGGWEMVGRGEDRRYRRREVTLVRSSQPKRYDLEVRFPAAAAAGLAPSPGQDPTFDEPPPNLWEILSREFRRRIRANRSTLLFANSRRTTEKVTRLLNREQEGGELAYSHHGSLSREIRSVVERRLKEGRLAAIVATNSLELGIDIGALDEVILIQTPPTVASAVQRIGRAGHAVGEVSRGRLYPLFGRDLVDAAVVAESVLSQEIEPVEPVAGALDVLAQVILSMVAAEPWEIDELLAFLRSTYPYRDLGRRQYELVLEMLAGRYADSRIRELEPRISLDRIENRVVARRGAPRLIYLSGGTIPDRGYYNLRLHESMARIGELDEEFVWERSLGDTFSLGAQSWRIRRITHNDVLVAPARRSSAMAPFWRAEQRNRSFFLSERIGRFLERAEGLLSQRSGAPELARLLSEKHRMEEAAAANLLELLERQRAATGAPLPHRRHLLVERCSDPDSGGDRERVILHTVWGGRVNRPLAVALAAAWEEREGEPLQIESDNDCLQLLLPRGFEIAELFEWVRPDNLEKLLRLRLERTGFFGARFRESAGRALLLPRSDFRRRVPLWLNRQRAKKLLAAVSRYPDFPILVETWRTCLQDEFELESLKRLLGELAGGEIQIGEARTAAPSPFAANLVWKQTNRLMYEDDSPEGAGASLLRGDLLREVVFSAALRPRLPAALLDRFQRKLHRTYPGYAPRTSRELVEWVKERIAIPQQEWRELLEAVERDLGPEANLAELLPKLERKLVCLRRPAASAPLVCALETLPRLFAALGDGPEEARLGAIGDPARPAPQEALDSLRDLVAAREESPRAAPDDADPRAELIAEWLRFYGPLPRRFLGLALGLEAESVEELLESLVSEERLVIDRFREQDEEPELCDAENLERLLRLLRAEARPPFEALPVDRLPLFLAQHQGLTSRGGSLEALQTALEKLLAFPAPAGHWESELLPARLDPYYPSWLDSLLQESDLVWTGCGREKLTFLFPQDLPLLSEESGEDGGDETDGGGAAELFPRSAGRFSTEELAAHTGLEPGELSARLWEATWRGEISNTAFSALRRGALGRFRPEETVPGRVRRQRPGRRRWQPSRPFTGDWFLLAAAEAARAEPLDALDREELNKERVRLLLDRYGVLFRELLGRELPAFRWSRIFRSLRLMELSGEVLAGHFFAGVAGLQFASPAAFRRLREGLPEDAIYWMNALDPASPCGLAMEELKGRHPARLPSTHLVFHGRSLVVVSKRNGGELEIRVEPDHPHLLDYLEFLKVLLTRRYRPTKGIEVTTVNGEAAAASPYAARLTEAFTTTRDLRSLKLRRRYR